MDTIIRDSLNLTDGAAVEVEGFGFFAEEEDDLSSFTAFHVDQVSFSSDVRQFQQVRNVYAVSKCDIHIYA